MLPKRPGEDAYLLNACKKSQTLRGQATTPPKKALLGREMLPENDGQEATGRGKVQGTPQSLRGGTVT